MSKRINLSYFILPLFVVVTRVFLFKDFFHTFDPINFALAIDKFSVYAEQPHPPGYPIVVLLSKIVFLFVGEHLKTLQILNLIVSIAAVLIFNLFLFKLTKDKYYSFFASMIFSITPIFYFYGVVEDVYIFEALITLIFGYFAYMSLKNKRYLYPLSITYGLIGGIRFNDLLFFFPLLFYIFIKSKMNSKEKFINMFLIVTSILSWYIPTIISGGGYKIYSFHSKTLFTWVLGTSILLKNKNYWIEHTFKTFIIFIKDAFLALVVLLYLLKNDKNNLIFFILWTLPSFLFYFLIHAPKVGYYLTIIPPIYLFLFYKVYFIKLKFKKIILSLLIIIIGLNSFYNFNLLYKKLDKQIDTLKLTLNRVESCIDNERTAVFMFEEMFEYYRHFQWYLDKNRIYFLPELSGYIVEWNIRNGYIYINGRNPIKIVKGNIVNLDNDINKLVFVVERPDELLDLIELKNAKIEKIYSSLFSSLTIISYRIDKNFDYLFVKGYIIKK